MTDQNDDRPPHIRAVEKDRGLLGQALTTAEIYDADHDVYTGFQAAYAYMMRVVTIDGPAARLEDESLAVVFNQGMNDLLELLFAASAGRGRAALNHARSMFEHALTLQNLVDEPRLRERYMAHGSVVRDQVGHLLADLHALAGTDRKALEHDRYKKRRDDGAEAAAALKKYGAQFEKGWHPTNARERARLLGWPPDDYRFYQFSSGYLHGAAGGVDGTRRNVDGEDVHRLGPAMEVCPIALAYGLRFARRLLSAYDEITDSLPGRQLATVLDALVKSDWFAVYRSAVLAVDAATWANAELTHRMTVVGMAEGDGRRWFIHDLSRDVLIPADPPTELSQESEDALQDFSEHIPKEAVRGLFGLVYIVMIGVEVEPTGGAEIPAPGAARPLMMSDIWAEDGAG